MYMIFWAFHQDQTVPEATWKVSKWLH